MVKIDLKILRTRVGRPTFQFLSDTLKVTTLETREYLDDGPWEHKMVLASWTELNLSLPTMVLKFEMWILGSKAFRF